MSWTPSGPLAFTTGRMTMSHTETGNTGTRPGVNGGGQVSIGCFLSCLRQNLIVSFFHNKVSEPPILWFMICDVFTAAHR